MYRLLAFLFIPSLGFCLPFDPRGYGKASGGVNDFTETRNQYGDAPQGRSRFMLGQLGVNQDLSYYVSLKLGGFYYLSARSLDYVVSAEKDYSTKYISKIEGYGPELTLSFFDLIDITGGYGIYYYQVREIYNTAQASFLGQDWVEHHRKGIRGVHGNAAITFPISPSIWIIAGADYRRITYSTQLTNRSDGTSSTNMMDSGSAKLLIKGAFVGLRLGY